jgi:hypothetical protein
MLQLYNNQNTKSMHIDQNHIVDKNIDNKIFIPKSTSLKIMCNYSFSNVEFDIKKWPYFSHKFVA